MKLKDWLRPPGMFFTPYKTTREILLPKIKEALDRFEKHETKTDKNVFKALIKLSTKMATIADENSIPTKKLYERLWNENYYHIYSSTYKAKVHNTAAMIFEELVLRPTKEEFK
jgi:hypothetical protein